MEITTATANLISEAIQKSEFSQNEVAEKSLIPRSTFQRKLAGKTGFNVEDLYAVATVLGVRVSDLLPAEDAA